MEGEAPVEADKPDVQAKAPDVQVKAPDVRVNKQAKRGCPQLNVCGPLRKAQSELEIHGSMSQEVTTAIHVQYQSSTSR